MQPILPVQDQLKSILGSVSLVLNMPEEATHRRCQDHQKHSNNYPCHAEKEADQTHARPTTPREPDTCHKSRNDLNDKDHNGLCSSAPLASTDCDAECNIRCKEQGGEELRSMAVMVIQRSQREEGTGLVIELVGSGESHSDDQMGGDGDGEDDKGKSSQSN